MAERQRGLGPGEGGAAAVEFAIILPLLLLVLGGIVDFGRAMYSESILTNATREGARVAVMGQSATQVVERTTAAIPAGMHDDVSIPPVECGPDDDTVTVEATMDFDWIIVGPMMDFFGGAGGLPGQLASSATMRCGG